MAELWTGKDFKEGASVVEIREGLNHLVRGLRRLAAEVRPDLPRAEATKLLDVIDKQIEYYNANLTALNEQEVRNMLVERAAVIAELREFDDDNQGQ